MPTRITPAASSAPTPHARHVVRDATGNVVVGGQGVDGVDTVTPFVSTDDGDTWTKGDATLPATAGTAFDWAAHSDGIWHVANMPGVNDVVARLFTITPGGVVSVLQSGVVWANGSDPVGDANVALDSTGRPHCALQYGVKSMGTLYLNLKLVRRDTAGNAAGTWVDLGAFATGSVNHNDPTIAFGPTDAAHISWTNSNTQVTRWRRIADGVLGVNEAVASAPKTGSIIVDDDDNPAVTVGANVYRRVGGTWSAQAFTDDAVTTSSIARRGSGDATVAYGTGNIRENTAPLGGFDVAAETDVATSTNTLERPSARHARNFGYTPADDTLDVVYYDATSGDLYYASVLSLATIGGTVTADGTPTANAEVHVVNVDEGVVVATATPDANGAWTAEVPSGTMYHVVARYDDGTLRAATEGAPYILPT